MFDGLEIDVLSLGDADSILVSAWDGTTVTRTLIDGGRQSDYAQVKAFLEGRQIAQLDHVLCSHLHNDHAAGLIKLVADKSIHIVYGWMHNIRNHVEAGRLRRAVAASSNGTDNVGQVLENTDTLHAAFINRGVTPIEPFAGIAPTILGPSKEYYAKVTAEFTKEGAIGLQKIAEPAWGRPGMLAALAGINRSPLGVSPFATSRPTVNSLSLLAGIAPPNRNVSDILRRSSVKTNPTTQVYNNTSVILGLNFKGDKILLTADAGCEALRQVRLGWENLAGLQVPHHGSDDNLSKDLIERFRPQVAFASACGDESHPGSAVRNGLISVGSTFFSTHHPQPTNMWFWIGKVPARLGYGPLTPMKKNGIAAGASQRA
jgi:beta-lactamase superfamily II metal-dependent hydrolase